MPSAATLRSQIERSLQNRFPAALTPAPRALCEVASTGIENVDALLNGGLPVGAICEIAGSVCSGRTSLAMAFLAQRTAEGRVCAWVDVNDALDPESAAANGIRLPQLLWVRCQRSASPPIPPAGEHNVSKRESRLDSSSGFLPQTHPLSQTHARSGNHAKKAYTETQPVSGHDFSRAGKAPKRDGALAPAGIFRKRKDFCIWARMDQALRATDLLLQAGGFAAIVLDLGDTAREYSSRIPLATWFRYRQAAERTRASLLVLGQAACAQSSAAVVLECAPLRAQAAGASVLRGFTAETRRGRQRFTPVEIGTRKPPASTWKVNAQWETERRA